MTASSLPTSPEKFKLSLVTTRRGLPLGLRVLILSLLVIAWFSPDQALGIYGVFIFWISSLLVWTPGQPQTLILHHSIPLGPSIRPRVARISCGQGIR